MRTNRRQFLTALPAAGALATAWAFGAAGQQSHPRPLPDDASNGEGPKIDEKMILKQNQIDIQDATKKLYELASQLKAEVEKTDSARVLSIELLKKTEEIEKLCKKIQNLARG